MGHGVTPKEEKAKYNVCQVTFSVSHSSANDVRKHFKSDIHVKLKSIVMQRSSKTECGWLWGVFNTKESKGEARTTTATGPTYRVIICAVCCRT